LLVHSAIPNTPFFFVAFPDNFYLWKEEKLGSFDKSADYDLDANEIIKNYAEKVHTSPQEMSPQEFDILVADWLKDLVKAKSSKDSLKWATKSGLYHAIKDGSVAIEVALPELLHSLVI
jgi:hypothetical protein